MSAGGEGRGALAIVLHTHMPYVEGFGTWPFGEEWLWEAMAVCYLPLLDILETQPPITLSLTPVLGDQLAAPGVGERFTAFMRDVRRESHRIDIEGCRAGGEHGLAAELERAALDYERAVDRFEAIGADLLGALMGHVQWTSSATHAVLPLLATDAGIRLQLDSGIAAHRARAGLWEGGFWLPECAHAPWLEPLLAEAGVRATCVDLTDVYGLGAFEHMLPQRTDSGVVLVPIDRQSMELVWSHDGYPSHARYRDYHHHTVHHHCPWANDGQPYDRPAAAALAREHAVDFVTRAIDRLDRSRSSLGRPGLLVCALDTELLGHWWYEGLDWLAGVLEEASQRGLAMVRLDDALGRGEAITAARREVATSSGVTTWGSPRDLSTWDGAAVADLAWAARAAELRVLAAAPDVDPRAIRELLALQSSDWAFMITRELAVPYARERFAGHHQRLEHSLRSVGSGQPVLRNLAAHATPASLLTP